MENPIVGQTAPVRINSMRNETAPLLYIVIPDGYASLDYAYIRLRSSNNKEEAISKVLERIKSNFEEIMFLISTAPDNKSIFSKIKNFFEFAKKVAAAMF